jgi:hypothetical protein
MCSGSWKQDQIALADCFLSPPYFRQHLAADVTSKANDFPRLSETNGDRGHSLSGTAQAAFKTRVSEIGLKKKGYTVSYVLMERLCPASKRT